MFLKAAPAHAAPDRAFCQKSRCAYCPDDEEVATARNWSPTGHVGRLGTHH